MKLFIREYGEAHTQGPVLVILHGLFGMGDNWTALAKQLGETYRVIVPDLRNHGQSPHAEEMNIETMSNDLAEMLSEYSLENVILLGHSMGGKVAMDFALRYPNKVSKLVVADIAPRQYAISDLHQRVIALLQQINPALEGSRKAIEEKLMQGGLDFGVAQLLMKNLYWKDDTLAWRFNIDALSNHLPEIGAAVQADKPYAGATLFLRGGKSSYIGVQDEAAIHVLFPKASIIGIEGAGHWLHAEKPAEFLQAVLDFIA
jgi:pimeloyl-ACP methyl ester carboxylesterase